MKSKRMMAIGVALALLIAVVGIVLSVSLTACSKDVITVRSGNELVKAAGAEQEKTIVFMDDIVVDGDLEIAAPNKIDLNGFGLEVKGTVSVDSESSGKLVVGTTALILARRETIKAEKIEIELPNGHVEWNANVELPAAAETSADMMTVRTSANSFVFGGIFKINGSESDVMLTVKGGRFEISGMSVSRTATVLIPQQASGAAVENLSEGTVRVNTHSDVAVAGEVEIVSENAEVKVTALASAAETKITVTDGSVKKIDADGAEVVISQAATAGDVVADKLENNGTISGTVTADEIVNNGEINTENINAVAKAAAKQAVNDAFADYVSDDYSSENWAVLTKAKDDGLAAIDAAMLEAEITAAKNTAIAAMEAVETLAEQGLRELAQAKAAAIAELEAAFEAYDEDNYSVESWTGLRTAYENGLDAIEAATAPAQAETAKQTAIDQMAAFEPADLETLNLAKAEAKSAIEQAYAAYDEEDYTPANWTELRIAYNRGIAEVASATDVNAVNAAKQTALTAMAAIKNNAKLLAEAKTAAKAELETEFDKYDREAYTTNWSVLEKAYEDGISAIENAATIELANAAKQAAADAMSAIKSDKTLLDEAKSAATTELNNEYAKYKSSDYSVANYEQITRKYSAGIAAIAGSKTTDEVKTAKETAFAEMAAVKSNAQLLADAKDAAKKVVNDAFAEYSSDDYTSENWVVLTKAKDDGLAAIDAAASIEAAEEARDATVASMGEVKTYAILLEEAKTAAKAELKKAYDAFNKSYYTDALEDLDGAYNNGLAAIEAETVIENVQTDLENAIEAMNAVKADAIEVKDDVSLAAALEAQYSRIILTASIDGAGITVDYNLTFDLNGFSMTLEGRTGAVVTVNAGMEFTLCDGSKQKTGKIQSDYIGILARGEAEKPAYVFIEGGTIEVDNAAYQDNDASDLGYCVYADNAVVEMSGGAIVAKGKYETKDDTVFGINLRNGSRAIVSGGTVESNTYGVVVYYNSAFTLDGGTITATWFAISGNNLAPAADITIKSGSAISTDDVAVYMPSQGSLTVSGGYIKGLAAIDARMGTISISGGKLEATANQAAPLTKKPGGVAVYDGSIVLFNIGLYDNNETESRPTGNGDNAFAATVTGGEFISGIADGAYFSIYQWNTKEQSVTLEIAADLDNSVWFEYVDNAVQNVTAYKNAAVAELIEGFKQEDYSEANFQKISEILAQLDADLASANTIVLVDEKISAARTALEAVNKGIIVISDADEFANAVANQVDGDEWRISAELTVEPFVITKSITVAGTNENAKLTVASVDNFVTLGAPGIEVEFKNIALVGNIGKNGIYFAPEAAGAKLTLDNVSVSNVMRGVSIGAADVYVEINESEIVSRYYGLTVGASNVEVLVKGGKLQGWAAIMFTANGWTVDQIQANKGATVNVNGAELVGMSISNEGYGIVVLQQDYNGVQLTLSNCSMLATVEKEGITGAEQGGIVVRSYANDIVVNGGSISRLDCSEMTLKAAALVSIYNTYPAKTEADPAEKGNKFDISSWTISNDFEIPYVLRGGIDTLIVDFSEPLEGTYVEQDERWYDINSTLNDYALESDLTAFIDQEFYTKNQGTLTLKSGVTFTIDRGAAFGLNDGNTLVVESGATLIVRGALFEGKIVNNGKIEVSGTLDATSLEGDGMYEYFDVADIELINKIFAEESISNVTINLGAGLGSSEERVNVEFSVDREVNLIVNLNGHSIYTGAQAFFTLKQGTVSVDNGLIDGEYDVFRIVPESQDKVAKLTLGKGLTVVAQKWNAVYIGPKNKTDIEIFNAILVTEAMLEARGTGDAAYATIQGNGTLHGTSITINGGRIVQSSSNPIYHPQYGELIINDGEIVGGATGVEIRAGRLTINGGTITGNGDPFESDPNGNGSTTLGAAVAAVQHTTKLNLTVEIKAGTFNGVRAFYQADMQNNGAEALAKISITLWKNAVFNGEVLVDSAQAKIETDTDTRYYMSLQAAIDAANDDETVVVMKALSASGAEYFITLDENRIVEVDLNGQILTYTGSGNSGSQTDGEAIYVNAGTLSLKNGTIVMVNDTTGSVYRGIRVSGTGALTMNSVNVTSEDSAITLRDVAEGGKIALTMDGCNIESAYCAIYQNGSSAPGNIVIRNSTLVSEVTCVYISNSASAASRQSLTLEGCTITGTTAVEIKHTDATITDCTLIGTSSQISAVNGNGSCTEGFAFAVTGNGTADKATGTVKVNNCKFYNGVPASEDAEENGFYFVYTLVDGASVTVDETAADETGSYGEYVARAGNSWFCGLQTAVDETAGKGKSVELLQNAEIGATDSTATGLTITGSVTIDFNGFFITNVGKKFAVVVSGSSANLILKDSSESQTGGIYGGSGGDNQALRVESGATVRIEGGAYNVGGDASGAGNSTVSIASDSYVTIYGGRFASEKTYMDKYYVLNVQQTTGATGEFKVFGGVFVGQNPADGDDALGGTYIADGYESVETKAATETEPAEYTVQLKAVQE